MNKPNVINRKIVDIDGTKFRVGHVMREGFTVPAVVFLDADGDPTNFASCAMVVDPKTVGYTADGLCPICWQSDCVHIEEERKRSYCQKCGGKLTPVFGKIACSKCGEKQEDLDDQRRYYGSRP